MTVKELVDKNSFEILSMPQPDREIHGGYIGDLLSWVMGRAETDNAWITIMTNVNIVAVAALADVSIVIIAEGAMPDEQVINTACEKGINVVLSNMTAYETAVAINGDI